MRAIVLALSISFTAATTFAVERATPEHLDKWVTYYYEDPHPEEVPAALRAATNQGLFENDNVQAPMSGFFAEVFRSNTSQLPNWVKPFVGVPRRHIIYSALWIANTKESKAALETLAAGATPNEAKRLRALAASPPPSLSTMELDSPASLDFLWGAFMATGAEAPVIRIIDQIQREDTKGNIGEKLIGAAARWSVASNVEQHPRVREIVVARSKSADPQTRSKLLEILAKKDEKVQNDDR